MYNAWLVGDKEVVAKFETMEPTVRKRVRPVIKSLAIRILAYVKASKLSGQVLNVVTGTLRRSINEQVVDTETGIVGSVGTNKSYAAIHEYGFKGTVTVQQHLRTIKQAWGRKLKEPVQVSVRTYAMKMNMSERSYLRSALKDWEDRIKNETTEAAIGGAKEALAK